MKNPTFLLAASLITLAVTGALTQLVFTGLLGLVLLPAGLRRYPDCSPDHPVGWFVAAAAVFPASAFLFFLFSTRQPFTA